MARFLCPRCASPLGEAPTRGQARCPGCGLELDLGLLVTQPGQGQGPAVADRTGELLGPYRLEAVLGVGGMGTVYRARDARDGRPVALKLLYPQLSAFPSLRERFRREAQALRMLTHPRIVRILDDGEADGQPYLVMELVEGEPLDSLLRSQPPFREVARVGAQICEALAAAHRAGVIHRDLKPANVLWTPTGVRVLDFGIARVAGEDRTLTHSEALLGTLNYMSPEQRVRGRGVDHRADLFSLGVVLYHLLTGELPLGVFAPPSRLNPLIPRRFDALVTRALQPRPEQRFQSAEEMGAALSALARPARPGRALALAAACLALVGGAASAAWWFLRPPASVPPPRPGAATALVSLAAPHGFPSLAALGPGAVALGQRGLPALRGLLPPVLKKPALDKTRPATERPALSTKKKMKKRPSKRTR